MMVIGYRPRACPHTADGAPGLGRDACPGRERWAGRSGARTPLWRAIPASGPTYFSPLCQARKWGILLMRPSRDQPTLGGSARSVAGLVLASWWTGARPVAGHRTPDIESCPVSPQFWGIVILVG